MKISNIYAVYFSPVGSTGKVTKAAAERAAALLEERTGERIPVTEIDFTLPEARGEKHVFGKDSGNHQCSGRCPRGRAFMEAVKKGANQLKRDKMAFGYIGPNNGRFCRFRLYYYPKMDTVKVYLQEANEHYCRKHRNGYTDD